MNTIEYNAEYRLIDDQTLNMALVNHGIDYVRIKLCFLSAMYIECLEAWNVQLCIMIDVNSHVLLYDTKDVELVKAYKKDRETYLKLLNIVLGSGVASMLGSFYGPREFVPANKKLNNSV